MQVLVGDLAEPHLAGAAGIEPDRPELAELGVGHAVADAAGVVQEGAHDVGVERHFDGVPLAGLDGVLGPRDR